MVRVLHFFDSFTFRSQPRLYLAFSWLSGLGVGGLLFRYAGESIISMMPLAAVGQPSVVSLFLNAFLPFLFCAVAVHLDRPIFVLPVCFCRSLLYAYSLCAVFRSFPGCGWLIRFFLLFTSTCSCVLLYGYAGRCIFGLRSFSLRDLVFYVICLTVLVFADYCYISPFLRQLLL